LKLPITKQTHFELNMVHSGGSQFEFRPWLFTVFLTTLNDAVTAYSQDPIHYSHEITQQLSELLTALLSKLQTQN
jgi:hypothetical protein